MNQLMKLVQNGHSKRKEVTPEENKTLIKK